MGPWVELPRNYYFQDNYVFENNGNLNFTTTTRGCALSTPNRIIRWLMKLKGLSWVYLEEMFDQDASVASKDFYHCCLACLNALEEDYLSPLDPNSAECDNLKGHEVFKYFKDVMYASDVTKVSYFLNKKITIFPITM